MATNRLEEFLKKYPEKKAEIASIGESLKEKGTELRQDFGAPSSPRPPEQTTLPEKTEVQALGQSLKKQGVELKQDHYGPQTPPRHAGQTRGHAPAPTLNEGLIPAAEKRMNAYERAKAAPTDPTPPPTVDKARER